MLAFLDFEASSLGKHGYPIEVAWVFEDGSSASHLIRPVVQWTDWDRKAEAIHGIDRETLQALGRPVGEVADAMLQILGGHDLLASAPSWDGKWLSALLRAAGKPRHSLRLRDTEAAQRECVSQILGPIVTGDLLDREIERILDAVARHKNSASPRHRALEDAEAERQLWLFAKEEAMQAARRHAGRS